MEPAVWLGRVANLQRKLLEVYTVIQIGAVCANSRAKSLPADDDPFSAMGLYNSISVNERLRLTLLQGADQLACGGKLIGEHSHTGIVKMARLGDLAARQEKLPSAGVSIN